MIAVDATPTGAGRSVSDGRSPLRSASDNTMCSIDIVQVPMGGG